MRRRYVTRRRQTNARQASFCRRPMAEQIWVLVQARPHLLPETLRRKMDDCGWRGPLTTIPCIPYPSSKQTTRIDKCMCREYLPSQSTLASSSLVNNLVISLLLLLLFYFLVVPDFVTCFIIIVIMIILIRRGALA